MEHKETKSGNQISRRQILKQGGTAALWTGVGLSAGSDIITADESDKQNLRNQTLPFVDLSIICPNIDDGAEIESLNPYPSFVKRNNRIYLVDYGRRSLELSSEGTLISTNYGIQMPNLPKTFDNQRIAVVGDSAGWSTTLLDSNINKELEIKPSSKGRNNGSTIRFEFGNEQRVLHPQESKTIDGKTSVSYMTNDRTKKEIDTKAIVSVNFHGRVPVTAHENQILFPKTSVRGQGFRSQSSGAGGKQENNRGGDGADMDVIDYQSIDAYGIRLSKSNGGSA